MLRRGEWKPDTRPCTCTTPGKAITSGHLPPGTPCEIHHLLPQGSARGFDANLCHAPPRPRRCLSAAELAATRWDPPADGAIFIAGCHVSTGNVIGHWGRGLRLSPVTVGRRRAVHGWWAAWRRPGGTSPASALSPAPGAGAWRQPPCGAAPPSRNRVARGPRWLGPRPRGKMPVVCVLFFPSRFPDISFTFRFFFSALSFLPDYFFLFSPFLLSLPLLCFFAFLLFHFPRRIVVPQTPPTSLSPAGWSYRCIYIYIYTHTHIYVPLPPSPLPPCYFIPRRPPCG